jgi:hypothetical protein
MIGLLEKSGLERRVAEAADGVDEGFTGLALVQVDLHQPFDRIRHFCGGEARAEDIAQRSVLGGIAAKRDLVGFLAALLEAENADIADVMMPTGVDAAGNLYAQRPDLALARGVGEALRQRLRDGD